MNEKRLAEIEARLKATLDGPWEHYYPDQCCEGRCIHPLEHNTELRYEDAEFIVNARDDIPALIQEVRDLQEVVDYLESHIEYLEGR